MELASGAEPERSGPKSRVSGAVSRSQKKTSGAECGAAGVAKRERSGERR